MIWFLILLMVSIVVILSWFINVQISEKKEILEDLEILMVNLEEHIEFLQRVEKLELFVMNEQIKEMLMKNSKIKSTIIEFLEAYNGGESENFGKNKEKEERVEER